MNKKRWAAVIVAVIILLVSSMTKAPKEIVSKESENIVKDFFDSYALDGIVEEIVEPGGKDRIAIIPIIGTIQDSSAKAGSYNHQVVLEEIEMVRNDPSIKALMIYMDSPGGYVYHSAEVKDRLDQLKAETGIPIYTSMASLGASGGYWISMASDKIFAAEQTVTGSIGVLSGGINLSQWLNEHGIYDETFRSGEMKDAGSMTKPMTENQREYLQENVNRIYEKFVDVVAKGRKMDKATVRKLADGRVYDGEQAKELNLVDEIGYLDEALIDLKANHDLQNATVFQYIYKGNPFTNMLSIINSKNYNPLTEMKNSSAPLLFYGGMLYE
ncbi:MAG: signal peptide peptidase SppA [Tissierellia bacterium]|nr:signal peptide peptidase SppA [Tissierellia bacterium]